MPKSKNPQLFGSDISDPNLRFKVARVLAEHDLMPAQMACVFLEIFIALVETHGLDRDFIRDCALENLGDPQMWPRVKAPEDRPVKEEADTEVGVGRSKVLN